MAEFDKILAGKTEVFLQPGGFHFGGENTRIRTLLGSCVAITLWHPERRIGGMCHYMLPSQGDRRDDVLDGRYADEAMELFLRELKRAGTLPQEYEAKLFGGSSMYFTAGQALNCDGTTQGCRNIACRNAVVGGALARQHGFRIVARHLGGTAGCQVTFDVGSGSVWVKKHVAATEPLNPTETECAYWQKSRS